MNVLSALQNVPTELLSDSCFVMYSVHLTSEFIRGGVFFIPGNPGMAVLILAIPGKKANVSVHQQSVPRLRFMLNAGLDVRVINFRSVL